MGTPGGASLVASEVDHKEARAARKATIGV